MNFIIAVPFMGRVTVKIALALAEYFKSDSLSPVAIPVIVFLVRFVSAQYYFTGSCAANSAFEVGCPSIDS
jgi:hypothetical protein